MEWEKRLQLSPSLESSLGLAQRGLCCLAGNIWLAEFLPVV